MIGRLPTGGGRGLRRGFTLVEVVLALGLFSMLMVAVFQLLQGSLDLWNRGETRRNIVDQATSAGELLAQDLRALAAGASGDVLAEWVPFDTDGDGLREKYWPRLRLVRQATEAELRRRGAAPDDLHGPGLLEVAWAVLPMTTPQEAGVGGDLHSSPADKRAEGVLWRGERLPDDPLGMSFFEPGFFSRNGRPAGGALEEVSGGLLWMGIFFATQTSSVRAGWETGPELWHAATSWDGWQRERPAADVHPWNEAGSGMPAVDGVVLLPRRVRVELEFERAKDRRRRTRLADLIEAGDTQLVVEDGERVPARSGSFI
ncbi:MAG: type II secretion system protein, partial [Planctomycetota bacterium]|nr:type II secretion system protein [Planctomycetota bacterium]